VPELPSLERASDPTPHARILSNGRWTTLATGAGTGFSAWRGLTITRCELDRSEDPAGVFLYLRDLESGALRSLAPKPCGGGAATRARYSPGLLEIEREEAGLAAQLAICVHPEREPCASS